MYMCAIIVWGVGAILWFIAGMLTENSVFYLNTCINFVIIAAIIHFLIKEE